MDSNFNILYERCKKAHEKLLAAAGEDSEKKKKAFAMQIKNYRIAKKLSQDELARKLLVSKMQIIRWENARSMPSKLAQEKMKQLGIL